KLGLVPRGTISDINAASPTLTYNSLDRHISNLVMTKIVSNKSPWFSLVEVGETFRIAASHGQGRFIANADLIDELSANGQIASQYVDMQGRPILNTPYNPNGSAMAIEGITSPDGRILGRMCHSDRVGEKLYKNVPGNYRDRIFEAGVRYFR
ncbi:MAG: phosphoribosylformylglycinamidine synthase subunit PurQ, partial [Defluviitaleaceae bacterium]|nr:phosphoribosylformylglycinamidine synthase subunit PurQ [Defluviitaleaceae bacterium]